MAVEPPQSPAAVGSEKQIKSESLGEDCALSVPWSAAAAKSRGCGDLRPWSLRASCDFEAYPKNR